MFVVLNHRNMGDKPLRNMGDKPLRNMGDKPFRNMGDKPLRNMGDNPLYLDTLPWFLNNQRCSYSLLLWSRSTK